jgi:hypothetical protein
LLIYQSNKDQKAMSPEAENKDQTKPQKKKEKHFSVNV